jgi:hypothetical protein
MRTKKRKMLCVGVVALLLLGLVGSGVAVSSQAHNGDNGGSNGLALGNGRQEEVEQQTQNVGENKTIRIQQREEVKALNNGSKGLAPGQVKKEIPQLAAIKAPITVVHKAQGFALNESGDGFHVLRVNILKVRHIHPMEIRGLMEENKSISEIRAEITEKDWVLLYKGSLRLGERNYQLVNISVNETEGNRTFSADIVGPMWSTETSDEMNNTGHINVTVMPYEGVWIGDGTLTMDEGEYKGDYRVLLDVLPPRPRGR